MTECFYLEPTDRCRYALRRYSRTEEKCVGKYGYHNARFSLGETKAIFDGEGRERTVRIEEKKENFLDDLRWPKKCDFCEYEFVDGDEKQLFYDLVYRRTDTNEELLTRDAPPGAMWDAWWMPERWRGPDGRSLIVICPDRAEWSIDGPAKNCTTPDDLEHRCWLRTGDVPKVTVGKSGPPGWHTCSAGAGSIATPGYHGFLIDGKFT